MKQPAVQRVTSGKASLHLETAGSGEALICIHGGPGLGLEPFKPALFELSGMRQVILYDQRGCGKSSRLEPDRICPPEKHLADLYAILDETVTGQADILGHSFGSHFALLCALAWPEKIRQVILVSPIPPYPETGKQMHAWYAHFSAEERTQLTMLNHLRVDADTRANKRLQLILPHYFEKQAALQEFRERGITVPGMVMEECAKYKQVNDLRSRLGDIHCNVSIICGREDRRTPVAYSEEYLDYIAAAELHIINDCGHFPFMEQPQEFVTLMQRCLK